MHVFVFYYLFPLSSHLLLGLVLLLQQDLLFFFPLHLDTEIMVQMGPSSQLLY